MKKLKLSEQDKKKLIEEFEASLNTYGGDTDELKVKFEKDMNETPAQKLQIVFTPSAYLKSQELVKIFPGEVGWHGLMRKLSDNAYLVYDILVMPQVVSGARAIDNTQTNDWYDKYEDVMDDMRFQAHSHVDFATTPSTTDTNNQRNMVRNMASFGGVALFQIWNKKGDINSFFYDIDNGLLYDRKDIEIVIQTDGEYDTLQNFIDYAKKQVGPMTYVKPVSNGLATAPIKHADNIKPLPTYNMDKSTAEKMKDPFYWKDETGKEYSYYNDYNEEYGDYRWI